MHNILLTDDDTSPENTAVSEFHPSLGLRLLPAVVASANFVFLVIFAFVSVVATVVVVVVSRIFCRI